jgi:hypothetical protein
VYDDALLSNSTKINYIFVHLFKNTHYDIVLQSRIGSGVSGQEEAGRCDRLKYPSSQGTTHHPSPHTRPPSQIRAVFITIFPTGTTVLTIPTREMFLNKTKPRQNLTTF